MLARLSPFLVVSVALLGLISCKPSSDPKPLAEGPADGVEFVIQVKPNLGTQGQPLPISSEAVDQIIQTLHQRISSESGMDVAMGKNGEDQIIVRTPKLSPEQLDLVRKQLGRNDKLEFRIVHPGSEQKLREIAEGGPVVPGFVEMRTRRNTTGTPKPTESHLVRNRPDLKGDRVKDANAYLTPRGWSVMIEFDVAGGKQLGLLTEAHVNERLALILDGEILSAPNLNEPIYGGSAEISGDFSEAEAKGIASGLRAPLPNLIEIVSETSTGSGP